MSRYTTLLPYNLLCPLDSRDYFHVVNVKPNALGLHIGPVPLSIPSNILDVRLQRQLEIHYLFDTKPFIVHLVQRALGFSVIFFFF